MQKVINAALIGNPNTGKTSLFNRLTGLNQKVGNYSGVTVDRKSGSFDHGDIVINLLDLPGTYSLNTTSSDEDIVVNLLLDSQPDALPDVIVVVVDVENIKRNLLLFTQLKDLGLPLILAVNMADVMEHKGITIDVPALEKALDTKVVLVSSRKNTGIADLKECICRYEGSSESPIFELKNLAPNYFDEVGVASEKSTYHTWLQITNNKIRQEDLLANPLRQDKLKRLQHKETVRRYQLISDALKNSYTQDASAATGWASRLDRILTHPIYGYIVFFGILLFIFQAIYNWSGIPMDFIDQKMGALSEWVSNTLPAGIFTDLLSEGIISGIGGVIIFVPQIVFLFLFVVLLEESGYMSRVVFLTDRLMRPFGLSGKSIVPFISSTACAVPAVMATRTIGSWKERLITILVTPFNTCAARLPVYLVLIALIIPEGTFLGFSYKGLALLAMYLLGFVTALLSSLVLHKTLKTKERKFFMVEMPNYRWPLFKNIYTTVWEKTKGFVVDAGKIIVAISVVLWFLGSFGYGDNFDNAEAIVTEKIAKEGLSLNAEAYVNRGGGLYRGLR